LRKTAPHVRLQTLIKRPARKAEYRSRHTAQTSPMSRHITLKARRAGVKERKAREILSRLTERGLVASAPGKPKGLVALRFPAADRLFPFPQNLSAIA